MTNSVHDFTVRTIDGQTKSLADFAGEVLLIVNVASECGYTRQYEGLEKLQEAYHSKGFRVLGFPSNDFGGQEPGTEEEIQRFCTSKYGVTFDMFAKVALKGADMAPLYDWLQSTETNPTFGGAVAWNFNKFLIGKKGEVIGRFLHKVDPSSPELTRAVEQALAG